MNILFDTHVLLWLLMEDSQFPNSWKSLFNNSQNNLYVSSASLWELEIKKGLNKITFPDNLLFILESNQIHETSITWKHAQSIGKLPPIHKDPFDRMIVAQAIADDLVIATLDSDMLKYPAKFLKM